MKIWAIAWKDTVVRFRDRNALLLMLVAPLALAAIMGSALGGSGGTSGLGEIPIVVINEAGESGQLMVDILQGEQLADLLDVKEMDNLIEARKLIAGGSVRVVVQIPENFPKMEDNEVGEQAVVHLYNDPTATITPNIIRDIVEQILTQINSSQISVKVSVDQLLLPEHGGPGPGFVYLEEAIGEQMERRFGGDSFGSKLEINRIVLIEESESEPFSPFAFFAPGMGIFFLMFTMMDGTRSILVEEQEHTLRRLLSTPTSHGEILLGKIGGVFLTGTLQFWLFVLLSRIFFGLSWGKSIVGLLLMSFAIVAALTALGALIASFARDSNQANILGTVVVLISSMLGGNFLPADNYPEWLQNLSKLTVNKWGMDGLLDLVIHRLGVVDILPEVAVLSGFAILFCGLALWQFERRISY